MKREKPALALRLYVAGSSPNSRIATENLKRLAARLPEGQFKLEIVDVLTTPERALADAIFATPTLIKLSPAPRCRIVGNLNDTAAVLASLAYEGLT